ncbi:MAG: hypothetical protein ACOVNT_01385, partial [Flavobacterium macrobrachii]
KLDRLKVGLDTTEINSQIKDAKASLNSLKTAVKDTGQTFASAAPKVANAGNTLTQFSRIAQDAPFGIIGIGNNITATAESFSYLKAQTGSTGGALKALGASIAGPGGILLGVSLLTTGLTLLSQSGLSIGDVIDKITGNFDEFGASLKKAREEGAAMASKEIESLRGLVAVAQNDNISKQQRLIAVEKLQKQFPAYYGNLTAEKIMYGDLTKETKEATKALIARAVAEKLSEKAADVFAERLKANGRYIESVKELEKFDEDIAKKRERVAKKQEGLFGLTEDIIRKQEAGRISIVQSINDERNNIISLTKAYEKYTNVIDQLNETSAPLTVEPPKDKKVKAKKSKVEFEPAFIAPFVSTISGLGDTMAGFEDRTRTAFQNATGIVKEQTDLMKQVLIDFDASVNDLITNSIANTFSNLGAAIGDALATGGDVLSAIGTTIIQAFAGFLSDMGDLLIKYGTLAVVKGKLDLAIAAGGPISIGAGIAAIAVGVALKAAAGALGSFASSGGNRGGGGGSANNQSFSSSGFSANQGGGTVVFEISGQKLIGVLSNTINANRRLGGTLG